MEWTPISGNEIHQEIQKSEKELNGDIWNFWLLCKIEPEKWQESEFGNEGGGFWVVAICGKKVVWYNDIEEGFNISNYNEYKKIESYYCNQDQLNWAITRLYNSIKFDGNVNGQVGPPQPLT